MTGPGTKGPLSSTWPQALAERANCYGIADWLKELDVWLGGSAIDLNATDPKQSVGPSRGIFLNLRHVDPSSEPRDPNGWALTDVTFDTFQADLPFGLSAADETPRTAAAKLSFDTAGGQPADIDRGDHRISYFLSDFRFITLEFQPGMTGLGSVFVGRLGGEVDFRKQALR